LLAKITNFFSNQILVAFYLLGLSVIIRLPFFFVDVINWDESTFILMGQSVLDGHLPYTELWDLKPPLLFFCYGLFICLLGKSVIAIRLAGALCVALSAWLIYLVTKSIWNRQVGILAGTLFIIGCSLLPKAQATMSEYVALVPLLAALALLVLKQLRLGVLFGTGFLLASAAMIRLNLAYVCIIVGLLVIFQKFTKGEINFLRRGICYGLGSFLAVMLTFIPYWVTGYGSTWYSSVIKAPLNYADFQYTIWEALQFQINFILSHILPIQEFNRFLAEFFNTPQEQPQVDLIGISLLIWVGGIVGIWIIGKHWGQDSATKQERLIILGGFFFATEISILKSGATFSHYYIQIVPFFAIASAVFLHDLLNSKSRFLVSLAVVLMSIFALKSVFEQYGIIYSRMVTGQKLNYGVAYEIAEYFKQETNCQTSLYMMEDHLVYWLCNLKPLSKSTTHPSNITREYILKEIVGSKTSTLQEMSKILAKNPQFIVKKNNVWYLYQHRDAIRLLKATLQKKYQLVKQIRGRQIYRLVR
jgi:4-amino-4-deoxy-L-arabinose transferase-like glycosyltransferase